jgi:general secretion pathway protein E
MKASAEAPVQQAAYERLITADAVRRARAAAKLRPGEPGAVMAALQQQLGLAEEPVQRAAALAMKLPWLDLAAMRAFAPAFDRWPFADALRRGCVVLESSAAAGQRAATLAEPAPAPATALLLVVADPFDDALIDGARHALAAPHTLAIAPREDIAAYLAQHEESMRAIDSALPAAGPAPGSGDGSAGLEDLSLKSIGEGTSAVVKLVHSTLYDALKAGASDVHIESVAAGLAIKYRLDGTLAQVGAVEGREIAEQVLSRLKVMSELDIAERRVPQDGRFRVRAFGREIDFRVSIMPSIHGEDAVVRVLDKRSLAEQAAGLSLDKLGFDAETLRGFRRLAREPYGLLLVTGPTGSGKTTTLYGALSEIHDGRDKIITIEDPVEYQLAGVLQIPVNEKKGLTFARGLRSILRHDPDRIMVGEIRDPETAQIAIQAALTGHLVLSSVHANNSLDVIGRFAHMQVDAYSFVSALRGVLAQRLVRVNCQHCSEPLVLDAARLAEHAAAGVPAGATLRAGRGCGRCRGTGFKGRRAVGELLLLDDTLHELAGEHAPARQIREAARANGTRFLREAALALVAAGQTTLEEVDRVTLVA